MRLHSTKCSPRISNSVSSYLRPCLLTLLVCAVSYPTLLGQTRPSSAKDWDIGDVHLSLQTQVSNRKYLPFYHLSHQQGIVPDKRQSALGGVRFHRFDFLSRRYNIDSDIGFSGYASTEERTLWWQTGYASIGNPWGRLNIGKEPVKDWDFNYSGDLGQLSMSDNAEPIPKVGGTLFFPQLRLLQRNFLMVWDLQHGWLEKNRRNIQSPFWHEKSVEAILYLLPDKWLLQSKVIHTTLWAGQRSDGIALHTGSVREVLNVFFAGDSPSEGSTAGSHIIFYNASTTFHLNEDHTLHLFYQRAFEDKSAIRFNMPLPDGLLGMTWTNEKEKHFKWVGVEMLSSLHQSGPGLPDPVHSDGTPNPIFGNRDPATNRGHPYSGRDNLYNNYLYQSGYTYRGQVIGNPLMMTKARAQNIGLKLKDYADDMIVSNRIFACHFFALASPIKPTDISLRYTYVRHHGTYYGKYDGRYAWNGKLNDPNFFYAFDPVKIQHQMEIKAIHRFTPVRTSAFLSFAADLGQLYNTLGLMAGVNYQLRIRP